MGKEPDWADEMAYVWMVSKTGGTSPEGQASIAELLRTVRRDALEEAVKAVEDQFFHDGEYCDVRKLIDGSASRIRALQDRGGL